MGRTAGPDQIKIDVIRKVLRESSDGLWPMEISRKSHISKSTVHRYLTTYMTNEVIVVRSISELVKLYKLKS